MKPQSLQQSQLDWLLKQGVTMDALLWPSAVIWLDYGFYFQDDDAIWNPKTGKITGHFCLGADNILDADNYSVDGALQIHETPLAWLKANRNGIVVIDWSRCFDQLRDCPRVAVPKSLMAVYRRHMKPPRLPDVRIAA